MTRNLPQFQAQHVSMLCLALDRLSIDFQNPIWEKLKIECLKQKHNFEPVGYAHMINAFIGKTQDQPF